MALHFVWMEIRREAAPRGWERGVFNAEPDHDFRGRYGFGRRAHHPDPNARYGFGSPAAPHERR